MHATSPVVNVGLSQSPSNHQSSCLLLQLYRPLLARHPSSVRVEAGIRGILEPEVLRRPDWDCYERYGMVREREIGKEKGGTHGAMSTCVDQRLAPSEPARRRATTHCPHAQYAPLGV